MIIKAVEKFKTVFLLTVLVIIFSTAFIFAYSSDEKQLSDEFIMASTLQTNALKATTYTTTDIYNLLYPCLRDGSNSAYGAITEINNNLTYYVSGTNWSLAELAGMTWGKVTDISTALDYNNTLTNTTNAKLEYVFSAIEDTINIKWYSSNTVYRGVTTDFNTNYLQSDTNGYKFIGQFLFNSDLVTNHPSIIRVFIPIQNYSTSNARTDVYKLSTLKTSTSYVNSTIPDYFIETTNNGIYLYLFDFNPLGNYTYAFEITSNYQMHYYSNLAGNVFYIPFDTLDYQLIKTAFYITKSGEGNDALKKLADIYASDDYIAAKAAQQDYENDVINNFTGNGSGAASRSDQNNLKNTSGALKSGLSSGGSVSNSFGVFNNSSDIWMWFTNDVKNSLDTTQNNRSLKSSNEDEIIDFYHQYKNDAISQLGD